MSHQFKIGYKCSLIFYIFGGILSIFMGIFFNHVPTMAIVFYSIFFVLTTVSAVNAKKNPNLRCAVYGRFLIIACLIQNLFLSTAFDSAQIFIYAMCFTTIIVFVFIDNSLARFQAAISCISAFFFAIVVALYTSSGQTMRAYTFGLVVLLVMNLVIVSMTTHINFQHRKNIEQEKSLDDLIKVIEVKCDEAQNATYSKSRFLAHMSHEIRTPINAILGMNEMILRESDNAEISGYAVQTQNAADSLLSIINDILDITKIEAGRLTPVSVEYKTEELIIELYNLVKFRAKDKNLDFEVIVDENLPSVLMGDDIRLKQIVMNLLTNAVKYTHSGSVTLEVTQSNDDKIFFSVRDTGIGIRQEDIGRLFASFDRMDEKRNRNIEGTGLGLPITAALLRIFGSELNVESIYGVGSEFSFTIRQIVVDPTPVGKFDVDSPKYERKQYKTELTAPEARVLVIDDNDINRMVFRNLLKNTKINIDEASSGAECLKLVCKNRYDIIFMDHMMPEMDGVETFKAMKNLENNLNSNVPVIVLTANAVVGAREFYMDVGFDDFLSKPIQPDKLEKTVFAFLNDNLAVKSEESDIESEKSQAELPIISGIDWSYARAHFSDDESLLGAVRMFMKSLQSDANELNGYYECLTEGDNIGRYRVKVHSMKSSAALIGIFYLSGLALELENAARNENVKLIKALHSIFIERWLSYIGLLSVFSSTSTEKKPASEHIDDIREIFAYIREAAKNLDVDALDEMSEKLDEYVFDKEDDIKIQQIKSYIFNFEVEKLRECEY